MKHLAIDLDDVVLDFVGGLRSAIYTEYGVIISNQQLEDAGWELGPLLNRIIGYSWWKWLEERAWLWSQFPAMPGAIGELARLRHNGFYLELVTSKPRWAEYNVWRWLGKWRPPFHRVTIVGKDDPKVDFTNAALLVDDKPGNCIEFLNAGRKAVLFTRPHNLRTNQDPLNQIPRAANWAEVSRLIYEEYPHGR